VIVVVSNGSNGKDIVVTRAMLARHEAARAAAKEAQALAQSAQGA
jgi:hypothetical protein